MREGSHNLFLCSEAPYPSDCGSNGFFWLIPDWQPAFQCCSRCAFHHLQKHIGNTDKSVFPIFLRRIARICIVNSYFVAQIRRWKCLAAFSLEIPLYSGLKIKVFSYWISILSICIPRSISRKYLQLFSCCMTAANRKLSRIVKSFSVLLV